MTKPKPKLKGKPKGKYRTAKRKSTDVSYLKYKGIALDYIKNNYCNIQGIYRKYYPKASDDSIESEAYRLLGNVRFQEILEEVYKKVNVEDLNIARNVILNLNKLMHTAKKDSDKISASAWLGKSEAMFTDNVNNKGELAPPTYVINTIKQGEPVNQRKSDGTPTESVSERTQEARTPEQ